MTITTVASSSVAPITASTTSFAVVSTAPVTSPWLVTGAWAPFTPYVIGPQASFVTYLGQSYVCKVAHTSGSTFISSNWTLAIDAATAIQVQIGSIPASNITGLAPSATTDTTNATNITSGTLNVARLPNNIPTSDITGLAASATTDTTNASNITSGTIGSGLLPSGSQVLLGTYTASNSASLGNSTVFSGYTDYIIVFENLVPVTNAVDLTLTFFANGSFQTTSYIAFTERFNSGGGAGTSFTAGFSLCQSAILSNAANKGLSGSVRVTNPSNTAESRWAVGQCGLYDGTNMNVSMVQGLWNNQANSVTGIQVAATSGNISTGTIRVYGVK